MKAFISYSFNDSELYIIALLFEQLRNSGYIVETSNFGVVESFTNYQIQQADIFLGIITNNSTSINFVIKEWNIAKQHHRKSILIIEDGVNLAQNNNIQYIRFNRSNPTRAIDELFHLKSGSVSPKSNSSLEDALVLGGIIVGIAALLSLLAKK